jgi:hypothetical protein
LTAAHCAPTASLQLGAGDANVSSVRALDTVRSETVSSARMGSYLRTTPWRPRRKKKAHALAKTSPAKKPPRRLPAMMPALGVRAFERCHVGKDVQPRG